MIKSHMHEGYLQLSIYVFKSNQFISIAEGVKHFETWSILENHCVHKVGRVHSPELSTTGVR